MQLLSQGFLNFCIFVSFYYIVVFCNYLARVGGGWFFVLLYLCIISLCCCILQLLRQGGAVDDFLHFFIYVSFFCIFVFCNYLARVGRWVMVRRVTPRSFAAWTERIFFNHDLYCFLWSVAGSGTSMAEYCTQIYMWYIWSIEHIEISYSLGQKEFNTRDTITSERFRQRIGISKLFALNTCCTMHIQVC